MISILIPVYNTDIRELVSEILMQCKEAELRFELLITDDASKEDIKKINREVRTQAFVIYEELEGNIGRSKIRNHLVNQSKYDTLLFLDGDSKIEDNSRFIATYLDHISSFSIINGGRVYPQVPLKKELVLHHTYGSKRECPALAKRNAYPVRYFHSNNFMIRKSMLIDFPFPDMKTGYGYEDLALANQFKSADIELKHINNPVEHHGLISSQQFLENISSANKNLIDFSNSGIIKETPLLDSYRRLEKYGLLKPVKYVLNKINNQLRANLISNRPSLFFLDLYKLNDFINQKTG